MRGLDGITNSIDMSLNKFQDMVKVKPGVLQSMGESCRHGTACGPCRVRQDLATEQQKYRTMSFLYLFLFP